MFHEIVLFSNHALKDTEALTTRIIEGCEAAPLEHLQNLIRHSSKRFEDCKKQTANLIKSSVFTALKKYNAVLTLTNLIPESDQEPTNLFQQADQTGFKHLTNWVRKYDQLDSNTWPIF